MIVKEFYREKQDGIKLYKTYSDENKYIIKVGTDEEYIEAVDLEDAPYSYVETDKYIQTQETSVIDNYYEQDFEETNV